MCRLGNLKTANESDSTTSCLALRALRYQESSTVCQQGECLTACCARISQVHLAQSLCFFFLSLSLSLSPPSSLFPQTCSTTSVRHSFSQNFGRCFCWPGTQSVIWDGDLCRQNRNQTCLHDAACVFTLWIAQSATPYLHPSPLPLCGMQIESQSPLNLCSRRYRSTLTMTTNQLSHENHSVCMWSKDLQLKWAWVTLSLSLWYCGSPVWHGLCPIF